MQFKRFISHLFRHENELLVLNANKQYPALHIQTKSALQV